MQELTPDGACQWVRDADTLAVPLGPGQPVEFLHALGKRERFDRLDVFGALLVDAFALFTRPGVALQSGFYGPVERALRDAGHAVRFVPADFRRFARIAMRMAPRVMATAATPPDRDGYCSLALHAAATVAELLRVGCDPDRVLIVEANARLPRTLGLPPAHPHAIHVRDIDVLIHSEREPIALPDTAPTEHERAIAAHAIRFIRDGATLQTG